ncbi:hypothetical protein [Salinibacter sp.]|uniref:hypothetical protein n=1 Tax=Salinibacter sp. TaxID=2065818 RepID=UPI0021E78E87|nr:hypothetical protein [Salinibacter sp.]
MHDHFEEVDELRGRLIIGGTEVGECLAKVFRNPYRLNEMEVELFDPPELRQNEVPDRFFQSPESVDSELIYEGPQITRSLKLKTFELAGTNLSSFSKSVSVEKYRSTEFFGEIDEPERATVGYLFPLTTVVKSGLRPTKDARHGLYRGEFNRETGTADLAPNTFEIETPLGRAEIVELYDSRDVEKRSGYPVTAVVMHSGLHFKDLDCTSKSLETILEHSRSVVERIMLLFSLIEQNRITWSREKVNFTSSDDEWIGRQTTRRWSSPPTDSYYAGYRAKGVTHEAFEVINNAYWTLSSEEKKKIDEVLDNFTIAYTRKTIETGLLYWHSCLDQICQDLYGEDHRVFSKQIVATCDAAGIKVEDLLEEDVLDYWREDISGETQNFRFVNTRNTFVHDSLGANLEESQKVIEDRRVARALAERLLLAKIGVDPETVPLGDARVVP